jgi:hypothetical protein
MSITINLVHDLETRVRRAAKQEGVAPDAYVANVLQRHLREQTVALPAVESALLQQINIGLSDREWQHYEQLRTRLTAATLESKDQAELVALTDRIEAANVQRISALIQLAELRNTTLDALMDQLEIRPRLYA